MLASTGSYPDRDGRPGRCETASITPGRSLVAAPLVIDEATCDELIDRLDATFTAATPDVLASIDR